MITQIVIKVRKKLVVVGRGRDRLTAVKNAAIPRDVDLAPVFLEPGVTDAWAERHSSEFGREFTKFASAPVDA